MNRKKYHLKLRHFFMFYGFGIPIFLAAGYGIHICDKHEFGFYILRGILVASAVISIFILMMYFLKKDT